MQCTSVCGSGLGSSRPAVWDSGDVSSSPDDQLFRGLAVHGAEERSTEQPSPGLRHGPVQSGAPGCAATSWVKHWTVCSGQMLEGAELCRNPALEKLCGAKKQRKAVFQEPGEWVKPETGREPRLPPLQSFWHSSLIRLHVLRASEGESFIKPSSIITEQAKRVTLELRGTGSEHACPLLLREILCLPSLFSIQTSLNTWSGTKSSQCIALKMCTHVRDAWRIVSQQWLVE